MRWLPATLLSCLLPPLAAAQDPLPSERFVLDNGLTLVVHEDRKAPVATVSVWYHVGSKDERRGRTGFAHLFEHLMFEGSENHRASHLQPLELVGATDFNGITWVDHTHYFQTVPKTALDLVLWLESDRMGHLLGALDQQKLNAQRGVVLNEMRQGRDAPFGGVEEALHRASFPEGHPYRWWTGGSPADIEAATLEDVREWFRNHYGAANATVVVAGDVEAAAVLDSVRRHFAHIPPGPPQSRPRRWIAARSESTLEEIQERVPNARVYRSWNVPGRGERDGHDLRLVARILAGGRTSRLYRRLVLQDRLADAVAHNYWRLELAGVLHLQVDVRAGVDPRAVEDAIAQEVRRFIESGPQADELERARTGLRSEYARAVERGGEIEGQAARLGECQVFEGDPGCDRHYLARLQQAGADDLRDAARRWLAQGDHTLRVLPYTARQAEAAAPDRSGGPPVVAEFPAPTFPAVQRARLRNGIEVVLAQRAGELVEVDVLLGAGSASDPPRLRGAAAFTLGALDEGAGGLDADAIALRAEGLGAQLRAAVQRDHGQVGVSALAANLDDSLALLATLVRRPDFPPAAIERARASWLAELDTARADSLRAGLYLLPALLFGADHPYAGPYRETGTAEGIAALRRDDLVAWQRDHLRPDNARLVVSGGFSQAELLAQLERHFGDWRAPDSPRPQLVVPPVAAPQRARVFLIDRPGSEQTGLLAALPSPPTTDAGATAIDTMGAILAGAFSSRMNLNLREEKGWSYGAGLLQPDALGPRYWCVWTRVQRDRSGDAMREIRAEIEAYVGARPATPEEFAKVQAIEVRSLPGAYETLGAVQAAVRGIVQYRRADDWVQQTRARIEGQRLADVHAAARELLRPAALTWVVVGDLAAIEADVRALDLGEVAVIDADGGRVR